MHHPYTYCTLGSSELSDQNPFECDLQTVLTVESFESDQNGEILKDTVWGKGIIYFNWAYSNADLKLFKYVKYFSFFSSE